MSRRSRRGSPRGGWTGRTLGGLLVFCVLGILVAYLMLRGYLHSDGFRKFLSNEVSSAADVKGEFSAFRWDGLAVDTDGFEATGDGPVVAARADGLHTEVGFGGVRRGVWELKGTSVRRLEVTLDQTLEKPELPLPPEVKVPETKKERPKPWYPKDVEVTTLDVAEANVTAKMRAGGVVMARGLAVKVEAERNQGSYRGEITGGRITPPGEFLPEVEVERISGRFQDGMLFVTSGKGSVWNGGKIDVTGEWDTKAKTYALEGSARDIDCANLLKESWKKRISGTASSEFTIDGMTRDPQARGTLVIRDGVLTALPVLDALAAYADTRRFRVLNLTEARTDWQWRRGELRLSHIVIASEGLVRLEGNLVIRNGELGGDFRLGLAPGTLSSIPGAESHVFTPGEKGLLWTPLRISGTLEDPKEDLTERLIAAAGLRMFEQIPESGEKVLKFSRSLLSENPEETVRKGIEAVEKAEDVVREARDLLKGSDGLLEGILGSPKPRKDRKK